MQIKLTKAIKPRCNPTRISVVNTGDGYYSATYRGYWREFAAACREAFPYSAVFWSPEKRAIRVAGHYLVAFLEMAGRWFRDVEVERNPPPPPRPTGSRIISQVLRMIERDNGLFLGAQEERSARISEDEVPNEQPEPPRNTRSSSDILRVRRVVRRARKKREEE